MNIIVIIISVVNFFFFCWALFAYNKSLIVYKTWESIELVTFLQPFNLWYAGDMKNHWKNWLNNKIKIRKSELPRRKHTHTQFIPWFRVYYGKRNPFPHLWMIGMVRQRARTAFHGIGETFAVGCTVHGPLSVQTIQFFNDYNWIFHQPIHFFFITLLSLSSAKCVSVVFRLFRAHFAWYAAGGMNESQHNICRGVCVSFPHPHPTCAWHTNAQRTTEWVISSQRGLSAAKVWVFL